MINLAGPAFASKRVAHVDPPDVLGLLRDRQRALVGLLIPAGAVRGTSYVLLIGFAVDPDLPVAASHVSYQVDRLPRRNRDVFGSYAHLSRRGGAADLRGGDYTGHRSHRVVDGNLKGNWCVISPVGVNICAPGDAPFAIGAALKRTRTRFVEWNRWTGALCPPASGNEEQHRADTKHSVH